MKITREITMELNNELAIMGCPFRYKFDDKNCTGNNPQIELTLPSMSYVSSFMVHPTMEFFVWLVTWFKVRGIEISSNNDSSILWSKNGWDNVEHEEEHGWLVKKTKEKYYYRCSKCGDQYAVLRSAMGNSFGEEYKHTKNYCSRCGQKMTYVTVSDN